MEKKPIFYAKQPQQCNNIELKTFYDLVVKGGKVLIDGLEDRILNCELLAFCEDHDTIIGVSAIKKPSKNYREGIIVKAKISRKWSELIFEIGYSFTEPECRRKGISSTLKSLLLNEMTARQGILFSTTAIESSQKFLIDNGFKNLGEPYDGDNDEAIRYFEKVLSK